MKKIMILAVAAALLGISAPNTLAQVPGSSQPASSSSSQMDDEKDQTVSPGSSESNPGTTGSAGTSGTSVSGGSMETSGSTAVAIEYKNEVTITDLPAAVSKTISEKYPGFKAEKAYRGTDGTYKVKVSKGDEMHALFFDERGEFVKSKDKK